eukprot:6886990-Karenia_brevis.AAC.1
MTSKTPYCQRSCQYLYPPVAGLEQQWHEQEKVSGKPSAKTMKEGAEEELFDSRMRKKKFGEVPRWPFSKGDLP